MNITFEVSLEEFSKCFSKETDSFTLRQPFEVTIGKEILVCTQTNLEIMSAAYTYNRATCPPEVLIVTVEAHPKPEKDDKMNMTDQQKKAIYSAYAEWSSQVFDDLEDKSSITAEELVYRVLEIVESSLTEQEIVEEEENAKV